MTRWIVMALLAALWAPGANAQSSAGARADVTLADDRGTEVRLTRAPRRIVSLLPSLTESLCAVGGCALLVGTDRFSNWPASVMALPKVGGLEDAQLESIVALKPDVVLASSTARVTDRLESLGFKVIALESRNRADAKRTLVLLATMLGKPGNADRVWDRIEQETRDAALRVPAALRGKRVYFEVDATPYVAGAGSFVGEILLSLGLQNAVAAELGAFPRINPEYVVRIQPDIIMAATSDLVKMSARPGWSSIRALQTHRTCGFGLGKFDVLIRPGPRMGEAAAILADCLVSIAPR